MGAAVNLTGTVAQVKSLTLSSLCGSPSSLSSSKGAHQSQSRSCQNYHYHHHHHHLHMFKVAIPVAQGVLESVPTLVTQGSRLLQTNEIKLKLQNEILEYK